MSKLLLLQFLVLAIFDGRSEPRKPIVFTTEFIPQLITYNASPDPTECWEAVAWGIRIHNEKSFLFFSMPYQAVASLKEKIGNAEVRIEVKYFEEPDEDSGSPGVVSKITRNGEVIYLAEQR